MSIFSLTNMLRNNRFVQLLVHTKYLISFGFGFSFGLFALVILLGLYQTERTHEQIQSIVDKHNVKTGLIAEMMWAARERSLNLYHMVSINDPFERDDIFMQFNSHAATFGNARIKLMQMKLSPKERELLNEQASYTRITVPVQDKIIDLMIDNKIPEAYKLLVTKAVPYQNKVMEPLHKLSVLQQDYARQLAIQSGNHIEESNSIIVMLGMFALSLSIIIALNVSRRTLNSEKTLQIEKELAEVTLYSIGDAIITIGPDNLINEMNPVAEELTGWRKSNALRKQLDDVLNLKSEESNNDIPNPVIESIKSNKSIYSNQDATLIRKDDKVFAIEYTAAPITDSDQKNHGGIIVFRDVTPMRTMAYQLSYQASHDSLTGLVNRREFEIRLKHAIGSAYSDHQNHVLFYLDLDQFKIINDTCGHVAGDELLKQISIRLKSKLRDGDTIARLGGDEFGVLLKSCSIDKATQIAEQLRESIKEVRFVWGDKSFDTGVSIGVVPINITSGNVSDILSAADTACYEAKDQGRNRIHVYHIDDDSLTKRRGEMQWVHRITDALDHDKFTLFCQEIVPLTNESHNQYFYELLVRIQNDDQSMVMPMAFIPAAERYNLMPVIDKVVIEKALDELILLNRINSNIYFSINISGQSLCDNHFLDFVIDKFNQTNISPTQIIFEITETAAIANFSQAIRFIQVLKGIGCQFALDDFGSGLSSFAYLKNMPVDYLKIDGYFVRDIINDPTDMAFVESINQIGKVMGIKTIAEYVEDEQILAKLKTIGVNFAQGFHFGKPEPVSTLQKIINKPSKTSAA